jgi:hypothetical protein
MQDFTLEYVDWLIKVNLDHGDMFTVNRRAELLLRLVEEFSEYYLAKDEENDWKEAGDVLAIGTLVLYSFGVDKINMKQWLLRDTDEVPAFSFYNSHALVQKLASAGRRYLADTDSEVQVSRILDYTADLVRYILSSVYYIYNGNEGKYGYNHLLKVADINKQKLVKRLERNMMFTGSGDNRENEP